MKARDAIIFLQKETGTTQTQLAKLCGMKGQSNVSEALKRQDIKVSIVARFVEAMGYELVIQKKKPGRRTSEEILIDPKD